jgi:hypothetical protein
MAITSRAAWPDGDILFVSTRCKRWVSCWYTQVGIMYRCRPDGSGMRCVSANIEHDNTPAVLPDGRILLHALGVYRPLAG